MQATLPFRSIQFSRRLPFARPWATYLLTFGIITMMAAEIAIVQFGMNIAAFMQTFGLVSSEFSWINPGTYFTLITFNFLHSSAGHFAGNAFIMLLAGAAVEKHAGWRATLFIWMAGGMTSGVMHLAVFPDADRALVGASGAIAALLGAATVLGRRWALPVKLWRGRKVLFHIPLAVVVSIWVALQIFGSVQVYTGSIDEPSVATWVHLAGFMFGALSAGTLQIARRRKSASRPLLARVATSGD